ncbi:MAG: hypothetical protein IPK19_26395 [Chloroflexi bacterium]|nr:hypothetical protein [Chloroflexota bacterium]
MSEALAASCNPFFYRWARDCSGGCPNTLTEYARRMGFGPCHRTGSNCAEAAGQLPVLRTADAAISAAVGQYDIQVTMVQMARRCVAA